MTETEIIDGLLARNNKITFDFFYSHKDKSCRALLTSIIQYVFSYPVEYEEAVSEFYMYLMEDDGRRLRQIEDRNTLFGWIKVCATRYFIKKRDHLIENKSQETLIDQTAKEVFADENAQAAARKDVKRILIWMRNKRYAYVIQQLILNDMEPEVLAKEMNITTANLYNIKRRAMVEFTRTAIKDVEYYGR